MSYISHPDNVEETGVEKDDICRHVVILGGEEDRNPLFPPTQGLRRDRPLNSERTEPRNGQ